MRAIALERIGEPALDRKWMHPAPAEAVQVNLRRRNHRYNPGTLRFQWKGQYIPVTDVVQMELVGTDLTYTLEIMSS